MPMKFLVDVVATLPDGGRVVFAGTIEPMEEKKPSAVQSSMFHNEAEEPKYNDKGEKMLSPAQRGYLHSRGVFDCDEWSASKAFLEIGRMKKEEEEARSKPLGVAQEVPPRKFYNTPKKFDPFIGADFGKDDVFYSKGEASFSHKTLEVKPINPEPLPWEVAKKKRGRPKKTNI
jgi:hypothetical protein